MRLRALIAAAVGFALGFGVHFAMSQTASNPVSEHWEAVNRLVAHAEDPSAFEGSPPRDYRSSLFALVEAGELEHVDLVLPTVPHTAKTSRHLIRYVDAHEDIVWMAGNPSYAKYEPSGEEPLHVQLWFRPSGDVDVKQLIAELEGLENK